MKVDDGEYSVVKEESYTGNEDDPVSEVEVSLTDKVAGANTVYVKVTLTDGTNVTYAHDWIRLTGMTFSMTEKFEPIPENGYTVTYGTGRPRSEKRLRTTRSIRKTIPSCSHRAAM